uniref:Medium-chain specific acyl-CoA dehydrogenase, mitochondrial n=1 Tax=Parascaris univalens TaxID=6257 RepID=A0A915A6S4_PARUN
AVFCAFSMRIISQLRYALRRVFEQDHLHEWRRAQRRTPSPVAVPLKTVPTVIHNPSHRTHTKFSAKFDSHRKTAKNDVASARSSKQVKKNEDELEVDATERSRSESSKNYSKSSKSASSARKKRKRLMSLTRSLVE